MIAAEPGQETLASRAAQLFRAFRDGDEASMGQLVELLTPILWHTVRAQRVERETAEDVVQTTWLTLVRAADSITDPQAVLQWLLVTARRESWRVVKRADRVEATDFTGDEVVAPAADAPDESVLRATSGSLLWTHIRQLPERCQALLRVIAFADKPDYAAVARSLGMPVGSIGPTRGRCLAKLRLSLSADPSWET